MSVGVGNAAPRLFIASSTEGKAIADYIATQLGGQFLVQPWYQDAFALGDFIGKRLVQLAANFDFGIFIFSPDDAIEIKGQPFRTARDNVIYELGLFTGCLGHNRAIVLWPSDVPDFREMPDISGLVKTYYSWASIQQNLETAMRPACLQIESHIEQSGLKGEKLDDSFVDKWRQQLEEAGKKTEMSLSELRKSVISKRRYKNCNITFSTEDIALGGTDVVVSSDDNFLSASGGVARAIANKGGHYLRNELNRRRVHKHKSGHLAVTSPGDLECRAVIHAVTIDFVFRVFPSRPLVTSLATDVLACAEAMGARSVAMPLLGSGAGGVNKSECLSSLSAGIRAFLDQRSRTRSGIDEIKIVTAFPAEQFERRAVQALAFGQSLT